LTKLSFANLEVLYSNKIFYIHMKYNIIVNVTKIINHRSYIDSLIILQTKHIIYLSVGVKQVKWLTRQRTNETEDPG